jgi:hypothetical protein
MADKKQFSNTKSIVKVETGIVTLISYHHYLKIVGNNKLWTHMQKQSWNIHGMKILICSIRAYVCLPWIDAAFNQNLKLYLNIFIFHPPLIFPTPLARGRASQTEQRSAHWASWYPRVTWASNFRFFQPVDFSYFCVIQYLDTIM